MDRKELVAVVDDERSVREALCVALLERGYAVLAFPDGEAALEGLSSEDPAVVVLDVMMGGLDGVGFCRRWREGHPRTGIVFISSRSSDDDKIRALEAGGDDYLSKPFSLAEFAIRVDVCVARRKRLEAGSAVAEPAPGGAGLLREGPFELDPPSWEARYRGRPLALTVTEFRMLSLLLSWPGRVFDREQLIRGAYPEDAWAADRNVDAHVKRLRRKLRSIEPGSEEIETVHGVGYRYRRTPP